MRSSCAILSVLLAVLILSAAMPASAHINLLENPGFETGSFPPWDWDNDVEYDEYADAWVSDEDTHSGSYSVGMDVDGETAWVWIEQDITPQCAEYLEFWYVYDDIHNADDYGLDVHVYYSDGGEDYLDFPYSSEWEEAYIGLDTTKLVVEVEIELGIHQFDWGYVRIYVDDVDLEACTGSLSGHVYTFDLKPIEGAIVTADGQSTTTFGDGTYEFLLILTGTYTMTVTASCYYPSGAEGVVVVEDLETTQDFILTFACPVGGVVLPANMLGVLSPWLVVIGLVGCAATVVVVPKKRQS